MPISTKESPHKRRREQAHSSIIWPRKEFVYIVDGTSLIWFLFYIGVNCLPRLSSVCLCVSRCVWSICLNLKCAFRLVKWALFPLQSPFSMVKSEEEKTLPEAQRTLAIELVKVVFICPSLSASDSPLSPFVLIFKIFTQGGSKHFNWIVVCNSLNEEWCWSGGSLLNWTTGHFRMFRDIKLYNRIFHRRIFQDILGYWTEQQDI